MATNSLASVLLKIEANMEKSRNRAPVELPADPKSPPPLVQLPLWAEPVRGVPNSILRSALFGAIKRGKRAYQDAVKKASVDGVTVIHTGPQLDQADLDAWEHCLHLARKFGLGSHIHFSANSFLRDIGRATGKSQHEWLKGALRRLMTSLVELEDGKRAYAGQLIQEWFRDDKTGHHVIKINPKIAAMYGTDGWTQIEWQQRQALRKQPLAQWLHGFYSTHAAPYPYKVSTLHDLCGSENGQIAGFHRDLLDALNMLKEATAWTWEINESNLVRINKKPTGSQARHLIREKAKKIGTA